MPGFEGNSLQKNESARKVKPEEKDGGLVPSGVRGRGSNMKVPSLHYI